MSTFDTAARSATLQQAALEASTVPKRKHPVFNRRELRLLGIAHLFGRTILLSRDVDCHRMIKRLLSRVAAAGESTFSSARKRAQSLNALAWRPRPHARMCGVNRRKNLQVLFRLGLCSLSPFPVLLNAATGKEYALATTTTMTLWICLSPTTARTCCIATTETELSRM